MKVVTDIVVDLPLYCLISALVILRCHAAQCIVKIKSKTIFHIVKATGYSFCYSYIQSVYTYRLLPFKGLSEAVSESLSGNQITV